MDIEFHYYLTVIIAHQAGFTTDEAIDRKVHGLEAPHNEILHRFTVFKDEYWWKEDVEKEKTYWFRFQEAVKGHQAFALNPINDKFKYMGIKV